MKKKQKIAMKKLWLLLKAVLSGCNYPGDNTQVAIFLGGNRSGAIAVYWNRLGGTIVLGGNCPRTVLAWMDDTLYFCSNNFELVPPRANVLLWFYLLIFLFFQINWSKSPFFAETLNLTFGWPSKERCQYCIRIKWWYVWVELFPYNFKTRVFTQSHQ